MTVGVPVVAAVPDPFPRSRATPRSREPTDEQALAGEMERVLTDDATRSRADRPRAATACSFSWDHTARALASCYRRLADRTRRREGRAARRSVAAAGSGRHRALRDRAPAALADRSTSNPSRSPPAPARACGARVPVDRPRAATRQRSLRDVAPAPPPRCPHRGRRRHAPSLAVPPVRGRPLVVTVHDIAFLASRATTDPGCEFPLAGLALTRRHATPRDRSVDVHRRELEREGFEPRRIAVVPFGVDPPVARIPTNRPRRRASRSAVALRPHRRYRRAAQGHPHARPRGRALRRDRPDLTLVVAGPRAGATCTASTVRSYRSSEPNRGCARRALPASGRFLPRLPLRGLRTPGGRGHGPGRAEHRHDWIVTRRGRRRRRCAVRTRRRRRVRDADRTRARRHLRPGARRAGVARAAECSTGTARRKVTAWRMPEPWWAGIPRLARCAFCSTFPRYPPGRSAPGCTPSPSPRHVAANTASTCTC